MCVCVCVYIYIWLQERILEWIAIPRGPSQTKDSPALQADSLLSEPSGYPYICVCIYMYVCVYIYTHIYTCMDIYIYIYRK